MYVNRRFLGRLKTDVLTESDLRVWLDFQTDAS